MYKILIVLIVSVRDIFKNRGATSVLEEDVYKTVLQRAGWALPMPFFYINLFFQNKKKSNSDGYEEYATSLLPDSISNL
jgi:hypothetical protein